MPGLCVALVSRILEQLVEKVPDCWSSHHLLKVVVLVVAFVAKRG